MSVVWLDRLQTKTTTKYRGVLDSRPVMEKRELLEGLKVCGSACLCEDFLNKQSLEYPSKTSPFRVWCVERTASDQIQRWA